MRGLVNVTYTFSFFFPHFSIYYIHSPRSLDLLPFLSFKKNDAALQQFHIPFFFFLKHLYFSWRGSQPYHAVHQLDTTRYAILCRALLLVHWPATLVYMPFLQPNIAGLP